MFFEVLSQAIESIRSNKMRTFLTMLGVVIGVSSVIMIFSAGNAGKAYINGMFSKLGANVIAVTLKDRGSTIDTDLLTEKDGEILMKNIPEALRVQYQTYKMDSYAKVNYGTKTKDAMFMGVQPIMFSTRSMDLLNGRVLTDSDMQGSLNNAVMDKDSAKRLFGNFSPIGKKVTITDNTYGSKSFNIVGVVDFNTSGGIMSVMGDNVPIILMAPLTTYHNFYNTNTVSEINIDIPNGADVSGVALRMKTILELTHRNKDKYSMTSTQDMQKTINQVINVIQIAILAIAAISLIVGGIGIMNIMLVAVTERTREIGIRKAIGAQKKDIIIQFLMEAILLTGMSGVVGIILGILPIFPLAALVKCSVVELISPEIILISIGVAILCGIFFGVYPAKKAADLDPIESLRYE